MKLGVEDVMRFQRSVFEGTIYDMSEDPGWYVIGENGKMVKSPLAAPFPRKEMQKQRNYTKRTPIKPGK